MTFSGDQHKFASWVYAVASENMLVWIVLSLSLFSHRRDRGALGELIWLCATSSKGCPTSIVVTRRDTCPRTAPSGGVRLLCDERSRLGGW
jgi:hypothetical protein